MRGAIPTMISMIGSCCPPRGCYLVDCVHGLGLAQIVQLIQTRRDRSRTRVSCTCIHPSVCVFGGARMCGRLCWLHVRMRVHVHLHTYLVWPELVMHLAGTCTFP
jgi:hypothetical protein